MVFKLPKSRQGIEQETPTPSTKGSVSEAALEGLATLSRTSVVTPEILVQWEIDEATQKQAMDMQSMRGHAAIQRRQFGEAKQQREDQRVIANAIREGAITAPGKKPAISPEQPRIPSKARRDTLQPLLVEAMEACMGKSFTGMTEFTALVFEYLTQHCAGIDSPVVDYKAGVLVVEGQDRNTREVTFEALKARIKREYKSNKGLSEAQRNYGRTLPGRKDATG